MSTGPGVMVWRLGFPRTTLSELPKLITIALFSQTKKRRFQISIIELPQRYDAQNSKFVVAAAG
jgi:hypothetical protein